ncbi:peptidoglycan-binding domain-containing protein [Chlorogloeopsis sp. ULAP01]|uniref:peptidoglycan-binding domain-containing protein n=1 Tax=Chlorogloeopsis sp. ULAP01 TaxID=3056483 RepID=UPI0030143D46
MKSEADLRFNLVLFSKEVILEYLAYSEMALANAEPDLDIKLRLPEIQFKFNWHNSLKSAGLVFASLGVLFSLLAPIQEVSAAYYGPGVYYVRTHGRCLNVRNGPSLHFRSVACYRNGSRLPRVVGYRNGFARLSTGNYVASNWISTRPGSWHTPGLGVGGRYFLRRGSRGPAVAAVQRALGIRGTGYYGPVTANAVRNFQARNGLLVDGIVGPQTRNALGIY